MSSLENTARVQTITGRSLLFPAGSRVCLGSVFDSHTKGLNHEYALIFHFQVFGVCVSICHLMIYVIISLICDETQTSTCSIPV